VGDSSIPDWMTQWQALSQQSLNAWTEATRDATGRGAGAPSDGFAQWARAFMPAAAGGPMTGGQAGTVDRLVDGAKAYVAFMQSLIGAAGANAQGGVPSWSDALRQAFAAPGGATLFEHPLAQLWKGASGGGMAGMPNPFGAMPPPADLGDLKAWLQLPAFGYLREHQEHQQKGAVAWVEYQEQMARYNAQMLEAARRGFELFEGKLAEREQPGRQIESLRALYDLWVDAAEEGYAEIALSREFQDVYGELTNAQMRLRSQVQQEVERLSVDLGMPTRSELNSIGERLQALRREVRAQRGGDALIDEIAALRGEFEALKAAVKSPRAPVAREVPARTVIITPVVAKPAPAKRPKAKHAKARKAPMPAKAPPARAKPRIRPARAERAVAAVAPGNFASRIAKFADASLGAKRRKSRPPVDKADGGKPGKKH
jgi:class III poly(R)-hydroxyalkanoic acid synthase PhaE subunit